MSATGDMKHPKVKFPGIAGASSLRRWVNKPVLVVPRQSKRSLVADVQVASTLDLERRTKLVTDLGVFEVGAPVATLVGIHPWASADEIAERTAFHYGAAASVPTTALPDDATLLAMRTIDRTNLRQSLVG